ncbi:MAG: MFS transporter [Actinomycetes bacterium]|nr:MFS transporter [Actinomycetes bacterium]
MRIDPRNAFYWHAFFLAVTTSFTEVNTVMPALILEAGGTEVAVGVLTAIMLGLPLITQLVFAGFLHTRERKKPYLLLAINLRVLALGAAAVGIALYGTGTMIIPIVFAAMTVVALSGAFAGVSYTELVGNLVRTANRRTFFVRRQVITSLGLLASAVVTRFLLGAAAFPDGYVLLFAMAAAFLLVATGGFWALREPPLDEEAARPAGGVVAAIRQAPAMLRADGNLRSLILVANLVALGFTSIPLVTALAHRSYELDSATVGTFVLIQIGGMLVANVVWNRLVRRGGFRLVLQVELVLIAALFPLALVVSALAPLWTYALLYLVTGAIISGQKIAIEGALVQISPDGKRALYAGVFGAANLGAAFMPLLTGVLVGVLGFPAVFLGAAAVALVALVPVRSLACGEWFREA